MSCPSLSQIPSFYPNPDLDTGLDVTKIDYTSAPPESIAVDGNGDGSMITLGFHSELSTNVTDDSDRSAPADSIDVSMNKALHLMTLHAGPAERKLEGGELKIMTHLPGEEQLLVIEKAMSGATDVQRKRLELAQVALKQQLGRAPTVDQNVKRDYDKEIREAYKKQVPGGDMPQDISTWVWTAQEELPNVHEGKVERLVKAIHQVNPPDLSKVDYRGLFMYLQNTSY